MSICKNLITIKGFVKFQDLYDERGNKYKLINKHSMKGYKKSGYFLVYPFTTSDYWFIVRELVLEYVKE